MVPSSVSVSTTKGGGDSSPSSAAAASLNGGGWSDESEGVDPDRGGGAPVEADPGGAGGVSVFPPATGAAVKPGRGGGGPVEPNGSSGNEGSGGISMLVGFKEVKESRGGGPESSESEPGVSSEPDIGGGGPVAETSHLKWS